MTVAATLLLAFCALQEEETVAWTNVRILTITRGEIDSGTIVIQGSRISAVGKDVQVPPGSRVIDGKGLVAIPGFVQPHSRLGIFDVATTSGSTPQHLAFDEINPSLDIFTQALRTGFTTFALLPTGGGIAGQGAILKPGGWSRGELVNDKTGFLRIVLQPGTGGKDAIRQALEGARKAIDAEKKAPGSKPD